jgi:hypothetical protein
MSCDSERLVLGWLGESFDMIIKQGAKFGPFEFELELEDENGDLVPYDLTGGTIICEIRKKGLDTGAPVASPTCTIIAPNKFTLYLSDVQTLAIPAGELVTDKASQYVFDIFFAPPSDADLEPLYFGNAICARRVSKPTIT